jgi:hypothetical protein
MIYGDDAAPRSVAGNAQILKPLARDRAGYRAHWRYNRRSWPSAMLAVSMSSWDDYEICDEAGAYDCRAQPLMAASLCRRSRLPADPARRRPDPFYRSLRWGKYVELFVWTAPVSRCKRGA